MEIILRGWEVFLSKISKKKKKIKLFQIFIFIELSNNLKDLTDKSEDFKILYERIVNNKECFKIKIQHIFTRLKNDLNNRVEELLLEVETYFNDKNL